MRQERFPVILALAFVAAGLLVRGAGTGAAPAAPPGRALAVGAAVMAAAQAPSAVEAALGLDRTTRRLIQQGLRNEGFDPGAPDGLFGPRTRAAIRAWQAARRHAETGYLDGDQAELLRAAGAPPAVPAAATTDISPRVVAAPGGGRGGDRNGPGGSRFTRLSARPRCDSGFAAACGPVAPDQHRLMPPRPRRLGPRPPSCPCQRYRAATGGTPRSSSKRRRPRK